VIRVVGNRAGVKEAELQPIERIGSVRSPILFLAGSKDPYTPLDEAESLFARAPSPKIFWKVNGARHEDLHRFAKKEYERRVGDFLVANLRGAREVRSAQTDR
jgi:fermentation-respiration switch protein FrsA (DUF1100 family)